MGATASPRAELSSISTALDDLAGRISKIAEASTGTELDWVSTALFEVERSMGEATRRLRSTLDKLRVM